jgi:glycosyltransferase A (GT-A) superfamily protein (DUF2064 family)
MSIGNQDTANRLSLLLARLAVENIKPLNLPLYLYHQEISDDDAIRLAFGETFERHFVYQKDIHFMANVHRSLQLLMGLGYRKAVLLVSDCPYLDRGYLERLLRELDAHDVVLQPAVDKGINAIGCSSDRLIYLPMMNAVSRSPGYNLLEELQAFLTSQRLSHVALNPPLPDIDSAEDVRELWGYLNRPSGAPRAEFSQAARELYNFLSEHQLEFNLT